ncbi:MAG: hypothetical protein WCJ33_00890 [Pseudomonadota bacterium]
MRMVTGGDEKTAVYGYLPAKLFTKVQKAFVAMAQKKFNKAR